MKVSDLKPGEVYVMDYSTRAILGMPAIHTKMRVKLVEVLPKGRARVEESRVTWDYENRPDGWTTSRYMLESNTKKPVTRTSEYEVGTRSIIRAAT